MTNQILKSAADAGIALYVENGELKFKQTKPTFPSDLKASIIANKQALISLLANEQHSRSRIFPRSKENPPSQLPLSFSQQRLWLIDQLEGGSSHYNMPVALQVDGMFDVVAAEKALNTILARHEVLRTVYKQAGETVYQEVQTDVSVPFSMHDLQGMKMQSQREAIQSKLTEDARAHFDLSTDVMLRGSWLQQSATQGVLLFNIHHIASDGWSMSVLVDEFNQLYQAYAQGMDNPLAGLTLQYSDYALWQQEELVGEQLESQLSYWEVQLADAPVLHSLPLDNKRPQIRQYKGGIHDSELEDGLSVKLIQLASSQQVTSFMLMHAVLSILLAKHSNSTDIVIGTPIANRMQRELESLIGFFVNTLALRTQLSGEIEFSEFLSKVKQVNLDAQQHQDAPFEQVLDKLSLGGSQSYTPLVQVMLSVGEDSKLGLAVNNDVTFSVLEQEESYAKFDLQLSVSLGESGARLSWIYDSELFTADSIARLDSYFQRLLASVVATPMAKLSELEMLSEVEQQTLATCLEGEQVSYADEVQLHELFEAQVAHSPDALAVRYENTELSYAALNARANGLAAELRQLGVTNEVLVGVYLPRGVAALVAILAVLKAGGAYVPLDPSYPSERLQHIVDDTDMSLVIGGVASGFDGSMARLQQVDCTAWVEDEVDLSVANLQPLGTAESLAYVMYTSGSTGRPKGVKISHHCVTNLVIQEKLVNWNKCDAILSLSTFAFDASVFDIFASLTQGKALLIVSDFDRLDFSQWNVTCRDFQSVICFVTTALFNRVSTLGQIWPANIVQVLFGGEQADLYAINQFKKSNPQSRLVHVYGPTETTVFATFCEIKGDVYDAPIGLPLSNVTGKIVDSLNAPCCHGAIGELLIGGKQLAKGYLNQAQNTADKFIFAESDGRRYYRTGDLVKLNAQNLIEYVGRTDSQIKLRGYRIELEEVEAAINSLDFVKSTAVVVSKNGGEAKLEAYLVLSTAEIEEDVVLQLTDSIKERLPEYMLPDLFFVVSELPLSANGKVDKIRLRTSQKQLLKSGVEHILPSSRAQQKLACIWAEILKLDVANIGLKDSFLNLGANSLHFVTLAAKIREQFEVEVAVSDIFSALELEKMTGLVLGKKNTVQHALPPILSGESEQTAPLSFSQKRLWLDSQLNESATQYNIVMAHKITGTFDINAAEQAFNQIIERHHVLRSVLVLENGEPVQRVVNDWKFNFEQVDLSDAYLSMGDEAISAFTQEFGHREFVFTCDLMLKAAIAKLGPSGDLALIVNVHHIATDGWSMNILIDEFSSFYEATINQKAADLEPLPLQYHDYAKWQHSEELIAVINEQKEFWSSNLEGAPEIHHLPLDFERPSMPDFEAGLHTKLISEELSQKANEMMAQYEVTDFMLFHSVFTLLLAKLSDCDDIIIGTPLANRVQNELSGLIGFFVNSLPLRVKVEQQQSFLTLLDSVKQTNVAVQSNQLLPFEQLVELIAPERNSAYSPVFQIEMNMNNTESTTEFNFVEQNLSLLRLENTSRQSHLDLVLSLVKQGQQYAVNFTFSSALFNHNTIVDMADCFVYLLEQVMLQPQQTLAKVSLLTEQQQASYYAENLARTLDIGEIRGVEQLFERQAKSHSERTAITMQCDKISYGELNTKSNQLAHGLIDKGVKAETIVAICMERSINSAVAMLGVLKAGGAYVYIEPNTPSERIEQILEQTAATIVLTDQEFMSVLSFDMELTMLLMDDNWFEALFGSLPSLTPDVEVSANNLMYVVFTSGSTGEPKGVMIERGSYVETIMEHINFLKINQSSKTLQCASLSFDAGPFHLFYGLCGGANVHMVTIDSQFSSYVDEHQLTHLAMPAAVFNSMAKSPLESVKVITFGGESPTKEAVAYWSQHCKLVNLYGPSEASVMVSRKVLSANQPITIGRAVSGAALYVLDPSLNPVPSGVRGELFIAGRALARGYLNNEPLTQEKFIDVTSLPIPGNRLYRTGDKAYVNADKDIVFVGRDDNQVKIRGYRIELSEITSKLLEIDEVKEAITLVETSESGEKRIVAYVCCGADVFVEPTDAQVNTLLRKQLKETLPAYMVPSVVKRLSVMPLNNSGKIDKQALPEIDFSDFKVSYQAAVSEQEQVLVAIWAELLEQNKDSISVLANFFEIGGHSLLAIKMVSLIAARLNVELDVGEVLQSNDLAILAELIANKQQEQKLKAALHHEQKGNEFEYEL